MKLKVIAFVAARAASMGLSHAESGLYGFGIDLDGTGAGAVNSGTATLYELQTNGDLSAPGATDSLVGNSSGTGVATVNLGTFVDGQNTLTLLGGAMNTYKGSGSDVTGAVLDYSIVGIGGPYTAVGLNFGANLTFNDPPTDSYAHNQLWDTTSGSTNLLAGLNPGTYTIFVYGEVLDSDGNAYDNNGGPNYELTFTVVPEPSTWAMMFGGLGALVAFQRLRRKSVS